MKKKVLIDCDGVVCNFMQHAVDLANKSGKTSKQWKYEEVTGDSRDFPFWNEAGLEEEWIKEGFCEALPLIEGSQEFVEKLRSNGEEILFVTSPPKRNKTWPYERRLWLEKHFGITRHDLIFAVDKRYVSGLTLIDDHIDNCMEWNEYNKSPYSNSPPTRHSIMVAQPWNHKSNYQFRTNSFDQMVDWVKDLRIKEDNLSWAYSYLSTGRVSM